MKASTTAALFALAFASPAIGGMDASESGSVEGTFRGASLGSKLYCTGVYLIPRSPEIDQRIAEKFGTIDEGEALQPAALTEGRTSVTRRQPPPGSERTRCRRTRFAQKFAFDEVPAGEYYVTMTASPVAPIDDQRLRGKTVELMQRVVVAPRRTVSLRFAHVN